LNNFFKEEKELTENIEGVEIIMLEKFVVVRDMSSRGINFTN